MPAGSEVDPFTHPDSQRRFWVASDEDLVARALQKPWAEWMVFLHPSQKVAVEKNFNGAARISGSAGTGKSVVAMHRTASRLRRRRGHRGLLPRRKARKCLRRTFCKRSPTSTVERFVDYEIPIGTRSSIFRTAAEWPVKTRI